MRKLSAFSVLVAIALIGCQSSNPLIGTWTSKETASGMDISLEMTVKDATNYSQIVTTSGMGQKIKMEMIGTYVYEKENLKLTPTDFKVIEAPAEIKKMMESNKQSMLQGSEMPFKIEGNKATVTVNGKSSTLTKK